MVSLYILGLLKRFGSQHGYQLKKISTEKLSDFTEIKLPTIYYHLEKMEAEGLLSANREKLGSRPEKTVYTITDKGIAVFRDMLVELLEFEYRPTFPSDGVFYFSDYIETREIKVHLNIYIKKLEKTLTAVQEHKKETLQSVPDKMKMMAKLLFSHHERHYQAELDWAKEALNQLN